MKIQISNLSRDVTEKELRDAFGAFGEVKSVVIAKGKSRGKAKGTATVEMPDAAGAELAIQRLRGKNLKGSPLRISGSKRQHEGEKQGGSRRHAGDREGGARGGRRF
ncbi:MAG: RNA recognition motif domain-containing protein [bacterium]